MRSTKSVGGALHLFEIFLLYLEIGDCRRGNKILQTAAADARKKFLMITSTLSPAVAVHRLQHQ